MLDKELLKLVEEKKPIILIGGVAGTGKTTLSNLLLNSLNIDHSIGTGWIREIFRTVVKKEDCPELFEYTFRPTKPGEGLLEHLYNAAKVLIKPIEACLKRARNEGTSLIIEGSQILPGLIDEELYDFYFFLKKSDDIEEYKKMFCGKTHCKRKVFKSDIEGNQEIEKRLIDKLKKSNAIIIPHDTNEKRKNAIIRFIEEGLL